MTHSRHIIHLILIIPLYTLIYPYCIIEITAYNVFITKREVTLIPYKEKNT